MNETKARNDFKKTIKWLLEEIERAVAPDGVDPYAGAGERKILEHTTREFLLDGIMEALGWTLGPTGDMAEEARIKAETTTFMDYVGVNRTTRAPLLIVEAKAWDKPFVSPRRSGGNRTDTDEDLIVQAIEHLKVGGARDVSPVTNAWHEYLEQVAGYVRSLKQEHGHEVERVVLTSGQWMLVFDAPTKTFLDECSVDERQFVIFHKADYVARSTDILDLLSRASIAGDIPNMLRPAQLSSYAKAESIATAYHGLHVRYEESGSSRFERRPRVLVYPAVIIQRRDGALLTVMEDSEGSPLEHDHNVLDNHLNEVTKKAVALLAACAAELGVTLNPSPLNQFPGFPVKPRRLHVEIIEPVLVDDQDDTVDEWMLATGQATHYLRAQPIIGQCRFHEWSACRDVGHAIGSSALSIRSIHRPRAFFTDTQVHHCAHQQVQDRRVERCRIAAIDERVCCQACVYLEVCWPQGDRDALPCGQ